MFKPAKRIALDGKVWWMVWDTVQQLIKIANLKISGEMQ